MIKAVIFDLDGTLFRFVLDYIGMRNAVRETLIVLGVPASTLKEDERIRDHVNKMLEYAKTNRWSEAKINQTMRETNTVMDRFEWDSAQRNAPMDGALEVLRSLRKKRLRTGLLTNNSKRSVTYLLEKYGFSRMLDVVMTRDDLGDFNSLKPSPIGLTRVLARLDVKPSDAVYVGDSVVDVRASLSVGATPIFVTTGYSREEEVKELHTKVLIIDNLKRLLPLIDEIENGS